MTTTTTTAAVLPTISGNLSTYLTGVLEDCEFGSTLPTTALGWVAVQSALLIAGIALAGLAILIVLVSLVPRLSSIVSPFEKPPSCCSEFPSWSWGCLRQTWVIDHPENIGLDGHVLLSFSSIGTRVCILGMCLAAGLVPIFNRIDDGLAATTASDFISFTIANLQLRVGDGYLLELWSVVAAMYILAAYLMVSLRAFWAEFIRLRHAELKAVAMDDEGASAPPASIDIDSAIEGGLPASAWNGKMLARGPEAQAAHSVLIEEVPEDVTTDEELRRRMELLFGDGIFHCSLLEEHRCHFRKPMKIEQASQDEDDNTDKPASDKTSSGWNCLACSCCRSGLKASGTLLRGACGEAMAIFVSQIWSKLRRPHLRIGIVTFTSLVKRNAAFESSTLFTEQEMGYWRVTAAPPLSDIIWENWGYSSRHTERRAFVVDLLLFIAFIIWCFPVVTIITVTNPVFLAQVLPGVSEFLADIPSVISSLLNSQLPMLAITGLLYLVPMILEELLWRIERQKSRIAVQRSSMLRTFGFTSATYYALALGGSTAISIWGKYFQQALRQPLCFVTMLATLLPQVAVYYIVSIVNQIALRPISLFQVSRIFGGIGGSLEDTPAYMDVGYEGVKLANVLTLACMYSVLSPMLMPFAACYFIISSCCYRWSLQRLFGAPRKNRPRRLQAFPGGGSIWFELFESAMSGLLLGTVAVFSIVLSCTPAAPSTWSPALCLALLIVLLIVEIKFWHGCSSSCMQLAAHMPYEDAQNVDADEGHASLVKEFREDYYAWPA